MPRKLKVLSGKKVGSILEGYGFALKRTVGSHSRYALTRKGESLLITIPLHAELKRGTLAGIVRELERCVERSKLEHDFYTE